MQQFRVYGALARLSWPSWQAKILLCVALAALAPWGFALLALRDASVTALTAAALAGAAIAFACFWVIAHLLRPIWVAAATLREGRLDDAAELPHEHSDEAGVVLAGIADFAHRIAGLHHRWVQRHPLTALPTREFLLLQMAEDLEASTGEILLGAVRLTDYDRLAAFDSASAELALKAFAARLSAAAGRSRPLAHVDRDCFAIWFRGAPNAGVAAAELNAICYALGAEIEAGDFKLVPDVEAGAAVYPQDGQDPGSLMTRALVSLAKPGQPAAGFDFIQSATRAKELFALEQDLRHAVAREQLRLHFQPVFDLSRFQLVGAEALLRWHHPQAGLISPARFIPILEEAGMTDEIGMWTLNAACREASNWQRKGLDGLKVAVNLSATQLHDPQLKPMIARTLDRHKLSPQSLEIELTETAATEDAERTLILFAELRAMGISLAIDDFGSGYSSLSYVKNLPFDKLKIDREFVVRVHERRDSQAICRSLIELCRGLGIKLLAEGVEVEEEVRLLRSFGCTLFQGYYFSRPLAAEDFIRRALAGDWPGLAIGSGPELQNKRMSA